MPGEFDLPLPDAGSLTRGRFTYFPVVPGRLEFAIEVRQAILRERPDVVALELPVALQEAWMRAVKRLPEISIIFYPDETAGDTEAVYVPIEPADPFTEAVRTGLETGAEIVFADPDAAPRPRIAYGRSRAPPSWRATPRASPGSCKAWTRTRGSSWRSRSTCSIRCWTPWKSRRRSR